MPSINASLRSKPRFVRMQFRNALRMGTSNQEQLVTPLSTRRIPQLRRNQKSLADVTNTLDEVARSYDSEYTDLCHVLEEVVDNVEGITKHRMTKITSLKDDIENLFSAATIARKSATDTSRLETHREHVQYLEREKEQLVQDILHGKDEEQALREKLYRVEQQMQAVGQERETVLSQTTSELPSLEYLKKVLHRLSHTYLTQGDSRTTKGFVCKKGSKDVRPFEFDESTTHYDQVNQLWKIISDE